MARNILLENLRGVKFHTYRERLGKILGQRRRVLITFCDDLRKLGISIVKEGYLATLTVKSDLYDQIKEAQKKNKGMTRIRELLKEGKAQCFPTDNEGVLFFGKRIVVPNDHDLR